MRVILLYLAILISLVTFPFARVAMVFADTDSTVSRPMTAGLSLAYPKTVFYRFKAGELEQFSYDFCVPVDLKVASSGVVSSFSFLHTGDSTFRSLADSALKSFTFVPGASNGNEIEQTIPARLHLRPQMKTVALECAVNEGAMVGLAVDYALALSRNGKLVPGIVKMGSYAYPNHLQQKPQFLPSIVARVELSNSGSPRRIDIVHSTFPGLDDQIISVLNWASFDISPVNKSKPLSEFYAAVIFHPAAQYPTERVENQTTARARSTESFLFQLLPDTLGLLAPPLPRNLRCDTIAVAEAADKNFGRISLSVMVDTLGEITIEQSSRIERRIMALIRTAARQLSFYPALQFDGRPCMFRGLIHMDFEGSTNVRVHVDWLLDRMSEPIR